MPRSSARFLPAAAVAAMLALGGCVDMFTPAQPPATTRWTGLTTAGTADLAECQPFDLQVDLFQERLFTFETINGRAFPRASSPVSTWWIEGYMTPANFVEFETRLQRPIYFRARPYAVWRGTMTADQITLVESGSPCHRQVVLTRS